MRSALLIGVIVLGSLASSPFAQAQHSAPAASHAAPPVAHIAPSKVSSSRTAPTHHAPATASAGTPHSGSSKPYPLDVYGLGASAVAPRFVGPVSPGGFVNPLPGTNTGHGRSKGGNAIIILGGGYGYGYAPDDSQMQAQQSVQDQPDDQQGGGQQPPYNFVQQVPDPRSQAQADATAEASAAVREPVVPLRDVGSFTLVTRDGNLLDAVAFTRSSGRLVYITPDGGRRTLAFRDLDVIETQRLNAERGTPITIPPADDDPPAPQKLKPSKETTN